MVKQTRVFGALIITIVICSFCNIILSEKTLAYDNALYTACTGSIPTATSLSIPAVENTCQRCASDPNKRWGALWIGNNPKEAAISISSSDKNNTAFPINLYGAAYTCMSTVSDKTVMNATNIKIHASYISPNQPSDLSRVAGSNSQKVWTGVESSSGLTLNVPEFINVAKSKGQSSETKIATSTITTYWDSVPVERAMNGQIVTTDDITVSLSVTDTDDTPVNKECPPEDCPETELKQGRIYSFSWPKPVVQVIKNTQDANITFRHVMGSFGLEESMNVNYHVWNANIGSSDCSESSNNSFWNRIFDRISSLFSNAYIAKGNRTFFGTQTATDVSPGSPNSVTVNGCIAKGKTKPVVVPVAQAITWGDVEGLWETIVDLFKNGGKVLEIFLPRILALISGGDPAQLSEYEQQEAAQAGQNLFVGMINASKQMGASAAVAIVVIEPDDYPFRIEALDPSVTSVEYKEKPAELENGIYTIYGDSDSVTAKFKHILKRTDDSTQVPVVGGSATKGGIQIRGKNDKTSIKMTNDGFEINQERTYNDVITDTVELGEKKEVCSGLTFNPKSGKANTEGKITESDGSGESNICVTIGHPYNFKLTTKTTLPNDKDVVYGGTTESFKTYINNQPFKDNHEGTRSSAINAQYITFITNQSYDDRFTPQVVADPCAFYGSMALSDHNCTPIDTKGQIVPQSKSKDDWTQQITGGDNIQVAIPDVAIGDKFCFAVAVQPADSGEEGYKDSLNNNWQTSGLTCRTIAKKPTFQVLGGSLYSSKEILASTTKKDNKIYGSWVEYAIVAANNELNKDLQSNGNLASGAGNNASGVDDFVNGRSKLTIANKNNTLGAANIDLSGLKNVPEVIKTRYTDAEKCDGRWHNAYQGHESNKFNYYCYSSVTIESGNNPISQFDDEHNFVVIYAKDTITISTDIKVEQHYDVNLDPSQVRQVLLISDGDINIAEGVSRVDAWLIADADNSGGGSINTCSGYSVGNLNADNCKEQLTVNGPVFAKKLILNRTANMEKGSETEPAEKFTLPVSAYYWAYDQAQKNAQFFNASINELAPRF